MDIASLIGIIMGFLMLVYGIISNHADVMTYLNFPSAIITFGGALFATMLSYSMQDFLNGLKSVKLVFKTSAMCIPETDNRPVPGLYTYKLRFHDASHQVRVCAVHDQKDALFQKGFIQKWVS